ncbi:MAG: hypothetical protein OXB90_08995 [Acidimicrobiaceae bacterium]|nr:hypothetical protein [Acidimicrobiaceae bacterium]
MGRAVLVLRFVPAASPVFEGRFVLVGQEAEIDPAVFDSFVVEGYGDAIEGFVTARLVVAVAGFVMAVAEFAIAVAGFVTAGFAVAGFAVAVAEFAVAGFAVAVAEFAIGWHHFLYWHLGVDPLVVCRRAKQKLQLAPRPRTLRQ